MKKVDTTIYRYAIVIDDYVYKEYSDLRRLKFGVELFNKRRHKPMAFRLVKLEVKIKEVDKIIL